MRTRISLLAVTALLLPALLAQADPARPATWAQPVASKPGLANLFQVTPALFRSAQPEADGMRSAEALGIRTILNLRAAHSDDDLTAGTKLRRVDVPMRAEHIELEDVVAALRVMIDPGSQPVLVHCHHGSDRTGVVLAAYRMVVQGWSKNDAIREMREGGYGFHEILVNIPHFLRELDVDKLRRQIGLPDRQAAPVPAAP